MSLVKIKPKSLLANDYSLFANNLVWLQRLWFHLQLMWIWDPSCLQIMWFQNCLVCSF